MSKTVFCRKYKKELPALIHPPQPGERGKEIVNTISMQAWKEWIAHQTILINEYRLSLMDESARAFLTEKLEEFMDGNETKPVEFVSE